MAPGAGEKTSQEPVHERSAIQRRTLMKPGLPVGDMHVSIAL